MTNSEYREKKLLETGYKLAKKLRGSATPWEIKLMKQLKKLNYNFKFQQPIVCRCKYLYIADFYFPEYQCIIEVNSIMWHTKPKDVKHDKIRKRRLKKEGYEMLVLWNKQIDSLKDNDLYQIMKIAELSWKEKLKIVKSIDK